MLNQTILVGRLTQDPEIKELESGKKVANMTIAVPRSWKNINGEYETDFIQIKLFNGIAQNTNEYCHKGDLVGVKGSLQSKIINEKVNIEVIAEKVTFIKGGN